ncbi:hypothetical protein LTR37_020927 [Vermiconidia calcicola]|uniref:Uncharacterized protein n=1 Tax=Vermiconidia calcicola TaxID=1690605 RepID=A0ACC3M9Z4_9PEZI|nr:hypothetical protein LTR37_020927 [Vermiconidia calcicola]
MESADDPTIKDLLLWTGKTLYWIVRPIGLSVYYIVYYILFAVLLVMKLLYRPLEFLLLPLVYFTRFVLQCLAAPLRFAAKFETLYIYLGIAAITGVVLGLVVSLIYGILKRPLGLDSEPEPPGRTATQYREEKRKQKAPLMSSGIAPLSYVSSRCKPGGKGLLPHTIMEEVDSDRSSNR